METVNHYLMHCRPRLEFHLGHIHILGELHNLLTQGNKVTILIIPYREKASENHNIQTRLYEDVELTKQFYLKYLGFSEPILKIVSTDDIDISDADIQEEHSRFQRMYQSNDAVNQMVDKHRRTWASPQSLFVAKCVAAIKRFKPTHTLCGEKHKHIADAFGELLSDDSKQVTTSYVRDFLDLEMAEAMDNKDTAHTIVEITDDESLIVHKLSIQENNAKDKLEQWLDHFVEDILSKAPNRIIQNVQLAPRTLLEKQIALWRFISNIRRLIPYTQEQTASELNVRFNGKYEKKLNNEQMSLFKNLICRLYANENVKRIDVSKEYTAGESPTSVFEVIERTDDGGDHVSNISVIKFGDPLELAKEKEAFECLIRPSITGGFSEITGYAGPFEGKSAIRYKSADFSLGNKFNITPLSAAYCSNSKEKKNTKGVADVFEFLEQSLYPTLWGKARRIERASIVDQYKVFLPAMYSVFINYRDPNSGEYSVADSGDTRELLALTLKITEFNPSNRRIRAYSVDNEEKVDVFYELSEEDICQFREGTTIAIKGELRKRRRDTFDNIINNNEELKSIVEKKSHPDDIVNELLEKEFEEVYQGPVHGDLHSGNIICNGRAFSVIDYGMSSEDGLIAHDLALLISDLYLKEDVKMPDKKEGVLEKFLGMFNGREKAFDLIDMFYYELIPTKIRRVVPENVFWSSLTLTFIGSLKFALTQQQQLKALEAAYTCFERIK